MIPSVGRTTLLRSVLSSLNQSSEDVQVIVVLEEGSVAPSLPSDPRLTIFENLGSSGAAANRNIGASKAENYWVTFLDDDDFLAPNHVQSVLLSAHQVREDHAWVTGVSGISPKNESFYSRIPANLVPKGAHWSLSPNVTWEQSLTKQSLFVPRNILLNIGGFDATLPSRILTEFFWRLNAELPIFGSSKVTYLRTVWGGESAVAHIGSSKKHRSASFEQLMKKHRPLMKLHPIGARRMLREHIRRCVSDGLFMEVAKTVGRYANPGSVGMSEICAECHDPFRSA